MNQKMHVGGIFYNLANASDFVNHEILLAILNLYVIQGVCVKKMFKSNLTKRTKKDVIK